nr:reverse transcriptase domain-containing protein [Tanacetum cinerariifolium]
MNSNNASTSSSGTLPSNTISNPKSNLKAITTRSGVSYDGPQIPPPPFSLPNVVEDKPEATKDTLNPTNNRNTEDVQPQAVQSESPVLISKPVTSPISEPVIAPVSASKPNPKASIPYPSRRNDERNHEKANHQIKKFYQIFKDMSFEISFTDALIHMPKFTSTLKALIVNKEKLSEMARTSLNEHCSTLTLRVGKEAITFNLDQTSRYSANYSDMKAKRIDVIDMACEEYSQEVLGFSYTISSGNTTPYYDPIVSATSPTLTPFGNSDFLLKEDQEKTTFTCPYGTFAYRRMPFGLCNAPGTFQRKLTEAPTLIAPDWDMPFELMYDASDFAIRAVLGQHQDKHFRPIHYASKTMTEAESNYTTTEKEMLAVEFTFKVIDTKGAENLAVDHLSRLENPHQNVLDPKETNESFPLKTLNLVYTRVGENRTSWSDKLDDALCAFHIAYKTPIDVLHITGDHRKVQINELNELRDQAYENSLIYKEKTKRLHDSKIKNRVFNIGDRVLLFNSRLKILSSKLKSCWSGPFKISQVYPYGTVELSHPTGLTSKSMVIVLSTILERTYLSW